MATNNWVGQATVVQQVTTITVGGTAATGQIYTLIQNSKTLAYTATGTDTNATIATALQALVSGASIPEFQQLTATVNSNVVTVTGPTDGRSFTITQTATGTGTLTVATATAGTGPNYWTDPANWSLGVVPANGDNIYFFNSSVSCYYGIDQSAGPLALALLWIDSTFTGTIGLPDRNPSGFNEYLPTRLKLNATACTIGSGVGAGSSRIRLDLMAASCAMSVYGTGQPATGEYAVDAIGTNAGNTLVINKGSCAWAYKPGSVATLASIKSSFQNSQVGDVTLHLGTGLTCGTLLANGGTIYQYCSMTTATLNGGNVTAYGAAGYTTLNNNTGNVDYQSSGTIGTYFGGGNAAIDFTHSEAPKTITNCTLEANTTFNDKGATVTFTNPVLVNCDISELRLFSVGERRTYQFV